MRKRKHKNLPINESQCLNCSTPLQGDYCYVCGQKAFLHKENFFHFLFEFIADYFHFDGKFFKTTKALFSKPGTLTKEYIHGKRKKYLNPIQMYLFVSALFFIFFNSLITHVTQSEITYSYQEVVEYRAFIDSLRKNKLENDKYVQNMGMELDEMGFCVNNAVYFNHDYDSIENTLPAHKKESGFRKSFHKKLLYINEHTFDPRDISNKVYLKSVLKALPKGLFVLLPLFALILFLFYRKFPYVDHIVFSLHFHIVAYIIIAFFLSIYFLLDENIFFLYLLLAKLFFYLMIAIKTAYNNTWTMSILKSIGISILYAVIFIISFLIILFVSIYFM